MLWLALIYYLVYEVIFAVLPEFIEYWAMGLISLIVFGAMYVMDFGKQNKLISFVLITLIDFAISFIFSDFADFLIFTTGMMLH